MRGASRRPALKGWAILGRPTDYRRRNLGHGQQDRSGGTLGGTPPGVGGDVMPLAGRHGETLIRSRIVRGLWVPVVQNLNHCKQPCSCGTAGQSKKQSRYNADYANHGIDSLPIPLPFGVS